MAVCAFSSDPLGWRDLPLSSRQTTNNSPPKQHKMGELPTRKTSVANLELPEGLNMNN